jgi:hypothetical protein
MQDVEHLFITKIRNLFKVQRTEPICILAAESSLQNKQGRGNSTVLYKPLCSMYKHAEPLCRMYKDAEQLDNRKIQNLSTAH